MSVPNIKFPGQIVHSARICELWALDNLNLLGEEDGKLPPTLDGPCQKCLCQAVQPLITNVTYRETDRQNATDGLADRLINHLGLQQQTAVA